MHQPNNLLDASIRSLQSKLRRVAVYERGGLHQIATRHAKDALFILPKNEDAAQQHYDIAVDAARRGGWIL